MLEVRLHSLEKHETNQMKVFVCTLKRNNGLRIYY